MNKDRRRLPLSALRAFESYARRGSMRLAAEELGVTHSAISRQISQLSDLLGKPLLTGPRTARHPTAEAQGFAQALGSGFDQLERALQELSPRSDVVDVSCLGTLSMRWLIPRLFSFQTRHPQIRVRLSSDDGPVDVDRDGVDVAIRVGAGPWPETAQVTPLFADRIGPVITPTLTPSFPDELLRLPRLLSETRPDAWETWSARTGNALPDTPLNRFDHIYFLIEAALAGLGVAVIPEILIRSELEQGRLIAPMGFVPSGQSYVALTRPDVTGAATVFLDWLSGEAKRLAPDT